MSSKNVLPSPIKHPSIPSTAKWLAGEGCGSWFYIEEEKDCFVITRYSPEGKIECNGFFEQFTGPKFIHSHDFSFTYLSHCSEVKIIQNNALIVFKRC